MQKRALPAKQATCVRKKTGCLTMLKKRELVSWLGGAASWCLPMSGNLVLVSLGRADKLRTTWMHGTDLAIFKDKNITTPVDRIVGKAGKPDPECNQVANRQQPEMTPHGAIMHHADSYFQRN